MVEMRLVAVRVELPSNTPVVLLQETSGAGRTLPIFIGTPEATAIAYALQGQATPRPFTHDLMRDVLDELGVQLERVVVTELREGTYYAELHLRSNGRSHVVSSRPSDAINLAARTGATIYCEDDLLDAEGVQLAEPEEEAAADDAEDLVDQFKEFIEGIRPEDFSA